MIDLRVPEAGPGGVPARRCCRRRGRSRRRRSVGQHSGLSAGSGSGGLLDDAERVRRRPPCSAAVLLLGRRSSRPAGLVGIVVVPLYWRRSASVRRVGLTTRRSAPHIRARALAGAERGKRDQRRQRRNRDSDSHCEPPLPRGSCWLAGDRSPGFRARLRRLPRESCDSPVAAGWLRHALPGHSGGTAPAFTGLPLTTGPYEWDHPKEKGRPEGRPFHNFSVETVLTSWTLRLHFWVDVAAASSPS